jgi:hypothetical protein
MLLGLAVILVIGVAAFFYFRERNSLPSGWTAITDGNAYGASVDATGAFTFPQAPSSVHYVTKACGSLAGAKQITLRYRIDADPGVRFDPASQPSAPSIGPTLYFQRAGDDWSGAGAFEAYRWWATFAAPEPIVPGEFTITAPFSSRWTAVETSNNQDNAAAFEAALANAARIGFTFGGGTGYGHGVYATGKASFTLLEFTVA